MKEQICRAFCEQLHVEKVLSGWAVSTPYRLPDGDPVMFFIVSSEVAGRARLEDDGATLALLEAAGVSLAKRGARWRAFQDLLTQHEAQYGDEGVIHTDEMDIAEIPDASVKFTALMLRVHDLALLSAERVKQSWQDDAMASLHARFDKVATVEEDAPVSPGEGHLPADAVIRLPGDKPPVAIIMGTTNAKGLQALVIKMDLEKYEGDDTPVVLLVEKARTNPLAERTYALAQSRLNGVYSYRGTEDDAMSAIARYVQTNETFQ